MDLTPFRLDIDALLDDFAKGNFTTLAEMKSVWLAKRFSYIFEAKPAKNSAFFMQSLFAHCIGHMVSTGDLSRRLGGLYCLYCLYEIQPYKPCFRIYLSLGQLQRLTILVVDAKENSIGVVPALVKRMLDRNMFLFGFVETVGDSIAKRVDEMMTQQNKCVQMIYEKLFAKTRIDEYIHMDLGVNLELDALKKMSTEYAKAKELAIKDASNTVDVEDIKHIAQNKKLVSNSVEEIVENWEVQKETFYEQTGVHRPNEIEAFGDELEQLLSEENAADIVSNH